MGSDDPREVGSEGLRLSLAGRHAEALERFVWFHEHALEHDPALKAVRLSFNLGHWAWLAERYPPARDALVTARNRVVTALRAGDWSADYFKEAAALNHHLGDEAATGDLFLHLRRAAPEVAATVYLKAEDGLVALQEYAVCGQYLTDPAARVRQARGLVGLVAAESANVVGETTGQGLAWARDRFAARVAPVVEILERTGRADEAARVRAMAATGWPVETEPGPAPNRGGESN